MTKELAIEAVLSRSFGEVRALVNATLTVTAGTIHAVVGENGAGKSTLLQIICGLQRSDAGSLRLGGTLIELARHNVRTARAQGVGLVQQHSVSVPTLSVVENAVLGDEPTRYGQLALARPAAELAKVAAQLGFAVEPWALAGDLSVGALQRAEIATAMWRGAKTLILDEPTAVLAPSEVDALLAMLLRLRLAGKTCVLVTHHLGEVVRVADEVTVLRRGGTVSSHRGALDQAVLAREVVGAELPAPTVVAAPDDEAARRLTVSGLVVGPTLGPVDLQVVAGELVGVAGVDGNGQDELVAAIAGLLPVRAGTLELGSVSLARLSVRQRQRLGLAHVPADRHRRGLVLDDTLVNNIAVGRADLRPGFWLRRKRLHHQVAELLNTYEVRPANPAAFARELSGGNQQKVVLARELSRPGLSLLLAANPTRGLDFGAVAAVHERLRGVVRGGAGALIVSADLDELLALCHRIVVMLRGRIVGEVSAAEPTARQRIGELMTGATA